MPMDFENLKDKRIEKLENNKKQIKLSTKCQWIWTLSYMYIV